MEKEREPGTARFGNFINYYSFNPPDRRTNLIEFSRLVEYIDRVGQGTHHVLDIGCNSGVSDHVVASIRSAGVDTL